MQLNLELEQLARLLALSTGQTLDAILKEALEARAREAGIALPDRARRRSFNEPKIIDLIERTAALPVLDARTPEEIIGYDEFGLLK